jgi:hypothetical protein
MPGLLVDCQGGPSRVRCARCPNEAAVHSCQPDAERTRLLDQLQLPYFTAVSAFLPANRAVGGRHLLESICSAQKVQNDLVSAHHSNSYHTAMADWPTTVQNVNREAGKPIADVQNTGIFYPEVLMRKQILTYMQDKMLKIAHLLLSFLTYVHNHQCCMHNDSC